MRTRKLLAIFLGYFLDIKKFRRDNPDLFVNRVYGKQFAVWGAFDKNKIFWIQLGNFQIRLLGAAQVFDACFVDIALAAS